MEELDHGSIVPLYYQLKDLIKSKVSSEEWGYNYKIPAEGELAETLEISVGTVKRALADLVTEGLLVRKKGKGTFVTKVKFGSSWIHSFIPESVIQKIEILEYAEIADPKFLKDLDPNLAFKKPKMFGIALKDFPKKTVSLRRLYFDDTHNLPSGKNKAFATYQNKTKGLFHRAWEELGIEFCNPEKAEIFGVRKNHPLITLKRHTFNAEDDLSEIRIDLFHGERLSLRQKID